RTTGRSRCTSWSDCGSRSSPAPRSTAARSMAGDTCGSCSRSETRRSAKRSSASGISGTCAEMPGDADMVLVDGKIFTAARDRPWAKALAVRGDRLLAVGTSAQAERWRGRRTRIVDLRGAVVLPGFIDAHTHMADSAGERGWTRLDGTRDLEDAVARLRKKAALTPWGGWVVGIDWDEAKWPERRFLTREDLDRASTEHAVVARRIDCHIGSLNSQALERASDLVGTRGFEVDASGRPTGLLTEDAFGEFHPRFESGEAGLERRLPAIA